MSTKKEPLYILIDDHNQRYASPLTKTGLNAFLEENYDCCDDLSEICIYEIVKNVNFKINKTIEFL